MPDPREREAGGIIEARIASRAERIAAGWRPRFVVDQTRVVEMVRLYQALGYETAVDPVRPEDLTEDGPAREVAGEGGRLDPRCGECRLVTLRWLHGIYTRSAPEPRGS